MTSALPELEAWVRLAGLAVGAIVVLIVPVTGFMKEYWAYQARLRESERLRVDTARNITAPSLAHFLEISDLAGAGFELAEAVRALTAALEARPPPASAEPPGGTGALR